MQLVQPETVELFEEGLKIKEIEDSAYQAYMQHFADISWSKKIIGGRIYFSEIQAVSSVLRNINI